MAFKANFRCIRLKTNTKGTITEGNKQQHWCLPHAATLSSQRPHSSGPICSSRRKQWKDPFVFRPERFLTNDNTAIDKTLSEKVMLFGLGKRRCIGEIPAKWEVFLFLAILLHQLEFTVPPGVKVDLTPNYGLTMKPGTCEHIQAWPRFSK